VSRAWRSVAAAIVDAIVASSLVASGRAQDKVGTSLDPQKLRQIERGRYLATLAPARAVTACPARASPSPAAGRSKRHSESWSGANITPDSETGVGAWTDDLFVHALRECKGHDGDRPTPPCPMSIT
jgi:hypothetical protein